MHHKFLLFAFAAVMISCRQQHHEEPADSMQADSAVHQHPESGTVRLDNGSKWKANPETTAGIKNMQAMAESFPKVATHDDYASLKQNLENEFSLILQRCTMSGEAHEQLHNYLMPLKAIIEKLDKENYSDVEALKDYLDKYPDYFS